MEPRPSRLQLPHPPSAVLTPSIGGFGLRQEREKANENYQAALKLLNEAINLDSNDVEAYIRRATVNSFTRDPDKAIQDLGVAIRLDPGNSLAYFARGVHPTFPISTLQGVSQSATALPDVAE